jgi:hypothetical protein
VSFFDGQTTIEGPPPLVRQWYHVAATFATDLVSVYVNGVQAATGNSDLATPNDTRAAIGRPRSEPDIQTDPTGVAVVVAPAVARATNGLVDEVSFYERAFTLPRSRRSIRLASRQVHVA